MEGWRFASKKTNVVLDGSGLKDGLNLMKEMLQKADAKRGVWRSHEASTARKTSMPIEDA